MLLVTGASGFIGTRLVKSFAGWGYLVRAALRKPSPTLDFLGGVESVVVGDLRGQVNWRESLKDVDTVIHLAARAHVVRDTNPSTDSLYHAVNVVGSCRLAEAAAVLGVKRLVFVSSSKVLGEETPPGQGWRENTPCAPRDAYGRSKLAAERALWEVSLRTGLEVVVLRPPVVYGPGVGANILELFRLVDRGIPLPLGLVENRRSLLFVDNLIDVIRLVTEAADASGETFHVSDGEDRSTVELVKQIAQAMGRPARLVPVPPAFLRFAGRLGDLMESAVGIQVPINTPNVMRLLASLTIDISKLQSKLGWHPPFTMEQGLTKTVQWYRDIRHQASSTIRASQELSRQNER